MQGGLVARWIEVVKDKAGDQGGGVSHGLADP
jgi:hypothetical protein